MNFFLVNDRFITETSTIDGMSICASSHWEDNMQIYYLTKKMRCNDPEFNAVCDRVGEGKITPQDEHFLSSRVLPTDLEHDNDNFKEGKIAIVVTTNRHREEINREKLDKLLPNQRTYVCDSIDHTLNLSEGVPLKKDLPYTQTGSLPGELHVKVGAPIMITVNPRKKRHKVIYRGIFRGLTITHLVYACYHF